jgi:hypothetical protein
MGVASLCIKCHFVSNWTYFCKEAAFNKKNPLFASKSDLTWFPSSTAKYTRTALFWGIPYRLFETNCRSHFQGKVCPGTKVRNYNNSLLTKPEQRRSQIGLHFKEETIKIPHLEHRCLWYWTLYTLEIRSKIPGKFWNVLLKKGGEDQLGRSCEKWSVT